MRRDPFASIGTDCRFGSNCWFYHPTAFYGVRIGRNPGVYLRWADCQEQVSGFSNNSYRKFDTFNEARDFVECGQDNVQCNNNEGPPPVCRYWQQGRCKFGDNCRYYHPQPESVSSSPSGCCENDSCGEDGYCEDSDDDMPFGFTNEQVHMLLMHGVKPYDDDVWNVLNFLMDENY